MKRNVLKFNYLLEFTFMWLAEIVRHIWKAAENVPLKKIHLSIKPPQESKKKKLK